MTSGSQFRVAGLTKIREHWGEESGQFLVQLHCEVTRAGDPGGEAFQVTVASPGQLLLELQHGEGAEMGRGYLFMIDYNEKEITARLQRLLDRSGATSWQDLVSSVTRFFDWID